MSDQPSHPPVSPLFAGLMCRCPGCGRGKLFRGFLGLPARCEACGLDYDFIDAGDRVVAVLHVYAKGRHSGVDVERLDGAVWTLRGGKAVRLDYYGSREQALEAVGLSE